MWSSEQLAYLAGIIDGEGSITVFASHNSTKGQKYECYCPRLSVYNCDERLMAWLVCNFRGAGRIVKRKRRPREREAYIWEVSRRAAETILRTVLPYMVIKRSQAQLFLEFRRITSRRNKYGKKGLPANVVEMREDVIKKIKFLNRRGPRALVSDGQQEAHA